MYNYTDDEHSLYNDCYEFETLEREFVSMVDNRQVIYLAHRFPTNFVSDRDMIFNLTMT